MNEASSFVSTLSRLSVPAYVWWRLRGRRSTVSVRLAEGPRIRLRPRSVGNNDYGVAYEVFVHRFYDCPRPLPTEDVRLIVDLGANVGFSCLYWLTRFPQARIIALEPHPIHFAQCRANLSANRLLPRAELYQAAAGALAQQITLSDAGTSSAVQADGGSGLSASMLDVFTLLSGRSVDLLKLDIEGGEYAILGDARFDDLAPRFLVMEWHGSPRDRDWCLTRLASLGYDIVQLFDHESHGMLWAFRRAAVGAAAPPTLSAGQSTNGD
jgi:FkbM family methyltransferase